MLTESEAQALRSLESQVEENLRKIEELQTENFYLNGRIEDIREQADAEECPGHESTSGPIGNIVFCDGSCQVDFSIPGESPDPYWMNP